MTNRQMKNNKELIESAIVSFINLYEVTDEEDRTILIREHNGGETYYRELDALDTLWERWCRKYGLPVMDVHELLNEIRQQP